MLSRLKNFFISKLHKVPFLLYGILFIILSITVYILGNLMSVPRLLLGMDFLLPLNEFIIWYSGIPFMCGVLLCLFDVLLLLPLRRRKNLFYDPVENHDLTVVLTAYNDELSIGDAVRDFISHPHVKRVIVVSNNSTDATFQNAEDAGAIVFDEKEQGYGKCVYRCLIEGIKHDDTDLVLLSEGDSTFSAKDINKFLAYIAHADIVNGTRIVEQLREYDTQLSTFMFYGNLFVAKLLEAKHTGRGTYTDMGTTYKLCRKESLQRLLPQLNSDINLSFNAHFLDIALQKKERLLECPITFYKRVGVSKGGNVNNFRAFQVGMEMIKGIIFGWKKHD